MLTLGDYLILIFSTLIIVSIIPLWMLLTYASSITKLWHPNLRMLEIQWSYYLAVILCGGIIYICDAFYSQHLDINNNGEVIARLVTVYGMYGMRLAFFCLVVERTFASIISRVYENRKLSYLSVILCCFTQIGGICFAIFCNYHSTEKELFHIITISTDFVVLILLACLVLYNRRLRNISLQRLELSQRFQVLENIRSLRAVFGVVFSGAVYNLLFSITIVFARHLESAMKYVSAIFFLGPIGFLLFQFVAAYNVNPNFRRKLHFVFVVAFCGKDEPCHQNGSQVKNAFGKIIVVQDTITDHFDNLKRQWS